MYLEASYLSNLTQLRLHRGWAALDAEGSVIQCLSIDVLLSSLENMPSLQYLYVALPEDMVAAPSIRSTQIYLLDSSYDMDLRACDRLNLRDLRDLTAHFHLKPQMSSIFDHLEVDDLERLTTSWGGYAEPVLF